MKKARLTPLALVPCYHADLLLLDEPTNHLSITVRRPICLGSFHPCVIFFCRFFSLISPCQAVMWLARELSTNPVWKERIIVIVSHDRAFLDEV